MSRSRLSALGAAALLGAIGCFTPVNEPGGGTTGGSTAGGSGTGGGTGGGSTGGGGGTSGGVPMCPATCPVLHSSCDPATTTNGLCICDPGYSQCGNSCVSLSSDQADCGACGHPCDSSNGYTCVNATCICGSGTFHLCAGTDGGPDVCSDPTVDPHNCGFCGNDCGALMCNNGGCTCASPLYQCVASNGTTYCADISHDIDNCGKCGGTCGPPTQSHDCRAQTWQCASSTGGPGICACTTGHFLCQASPNVPPNCVDISSDGENCGLCNNPCASAEVCVNSHCLSKDDAGCYGPTPGEPCFSDRDCCPPLTCDQNTNRCTSAC